MKYHTFTTGNKLVDEAVENYLMYGFRPGSFVTHVLANNLIGAVSSADHWNKQVLAEIVPDIVYNLPDIAWGSKQRVDDWCADKDNRRTNYAARKEKEYTWRALKGEIREKAYYNDPPF